jgi:hypothetical protein
MPGREAAETFLLLGPLQKADGTPELVKPGVPARNIESRLPEFRRNG